MICKKCHNEVEENYTYCPYCGVLLPVSSNIADTSSNINKQIEASFNYDNNMPELSFKNSCSAINIKRLLKNSSKFYGDRIVVEGEVAQIFEDDYGEGKIFIETPKSPGDRIVIIYSGANDIIEDDKIKVYGYLLNDYSYKTRIGATMTVPRVSAKYIDII